METMKISYFQDFVCIMASAKSSYWLKDTALPDTNVFHTFTNINQTFIENFYAFVNTEKTREKHLCLAGSKLCDLIKASNIRWFGIHHDSAFDYVAKVNLFRLFQLIYHLSCLCLWVDVIGSLTLYPLQAGAYAICFACKIAQNCLEMSCWLSAIF